MLKVAKSWGGFRDRCAEVAQEAGLKRTQKLFKDKDYEGPNIVPAYRFWQAWEHEMHDIRYSELCSRIAEGIKEEWESYGIPVCIRDAVLEVADQINETVANMIDHAIEECFEKGKK